MIVVCAVKLLDTLKIDDPVGAVPVHLFNGVFGTLCVGLFAVDKITGAATGNGLFNGGGMTLLIAQLEGIVAVAAYTLVVSLIFWYAIKATVRPPRQQGRGRRRPGHRRARPGGVRRIRAACLPRCRSGVGALNQGRRWRSAPPATHLEESVNETSSLCVPIDPPRFAAAMFADPCDWNREAQDRPKSRCDHADYGASISRQVYFFRGIRQEADPCNFTMFAFGDVGIALHSSDTGQGVSVNFGVWNTSAHQVRRAAAVPRRTTRVTTRKTSTRC